MVLAAALTGCTVGETDLTLDGGSVDEPSPDDAQDDAATAPGSGQDDAGSGDVRTDGGLGDTDAAQAIACSCVHGSCNDAGACECEPGYGGELCDSLTFVGDGRDGELLVRAPRELTAENHEGRTCSDGGDAVQYSLLEVIDGASVRLASAPAEGCLASGDELLVINLQGHDGAIANVGKHEFVTLASVEGDVLHFAAPKREFYGDDEGSDDNIGLAGDQQRVMVQRVPHYTNVLIPAGQTLTARAWDGTRGGVLAFRVQERLIAAGRIDMVARGYPGGGQTLTTGTDGQAGESLSGGGSRGRLGNLGGGGGGAGDPSCDALGFSGAGGGHATSGEDGTAGCSGWGGEEYDARRLWRMGSGGGAGGTDNSLSDNPPGGRGGTGGGVILLFARELYVYGAVDASGAAGEGDSKECTAATNTTGSCWDFCGPGGGGAGGFVALEALTLDLGKHYVRARGGLGGNGMDNLAGNGGTGSVGHVEVTSHGEAPLGQTDPAPDLTVASP